MVLDVEKLKGNKMNNSLEEIPNHMLELGLSALAHANRHSCYAALENHKWQEISVLQAAHASEILIKARIAQEHPLLILEQFPKISGDIITINELFEKGKTIDWSDLPQRLWACAGLKIPEVEKFREFGKLRNGIQHFMSPSVNNNLGYKVMDFIFSVLDPFINNCWGLYAIDFDEDYASFDEDYE